MQERLYHYRYLLAGLALVALVAAGALIVTSRSQMGTTPKQPKTYYALMQSTDQDDQYPGAYR